jgi:hypothetical protein
MNQNEVNLPSGKLELYKPEYWALVELMGHNRIVGRVTQSELGDGQFLQVDAIKENGEFAFTRILSPAAIYAINACTQEVAIQLAKDGLNRGYRGASPILVLDLPALKAEIREELKRELNFERESGQSIYANPEDLDEDEPL